MDLNSEVKSDDVRTIEEEKSNGTPWLERSSFRITLLSTFTALSVVLGYILVFLPNIELFTLMIFLTGFILGKRDGAIAGLMSSFIFVFFNPYGVSPLPLFAYQLAHYSLVGILGGLTHNYLRKKEYFKPEDDLYVFRVLLIFAIIGATITFVYDILSTLIGALSIFGTLETFWITYIIGLPFTTVHLIGNTLGFIFILPGLIQLLYKMLDISNE
ncbi:MAG: ECF transporter S component [Candidatus Hodarchaeota archaeon]